MKKKPRNQITIPSDHNGTYYIRKCQQFMNEEGWEGLEERARDLTSEIPWKANLAFACSTLLAAYGFGKPRQQLAIDVKDFRSIGDILAAAIPATNGGALPPARNK